MKRLLWILVVLLSISLPGCASPASPIRYRPSILATIVGVEPLSRLPEAGFLLSRIAIDRLPDSYRGACVEITYDANRPQSIRASFATGQNSSTPISLSLAGRRFSEISISYTKTAAKASLSFFGQAVPMQIDSFCVTSSIEYALDAAGLPTKLTFVDPRDGKGAGSVKLQRGAQSVAFTYSFADGKQAYRADGVYRVLYTYDSSGRLLSRFPTDASGMAQIISESVCPARYSYDGPGQLERVELLQDDPAKESSRVLRVSKFEYDETGNRVAERWFSASGEPITNENFGVSGMRYLYGPSGFILKQSYLGESGETISGKNGYASIEYQYDSAGCVIKMSYLGADAKPAADNLTGISSYSYVHDERGRVTETRTFDIVGNPTRDNRTGTYATKAEYSKDSDQPIKLSYFDSGSLPEPSVDGYYQARMDYDKRGYFTRESYFDQDGKPMTRAYTGCQQVAYSQDDRGYLISLTYLDEKGKPMAKAIEYAGFRYAYNFYGNLALTTYVGIDEKPKNIVEGFAMIALAYDERNRLIEQRYLDASGKLVNNSVVGYARVVVSYDDQARTSGQKYYDAEGKEIELK